MKIRLTEKMASEYVYSRDGWYETVIEPVFASLDPGGCTVELTAEQAEWLAKDASDMAVILTDGADDADTRNLGRAYARLAERVGKALDQQVGAM